MNCELCRGQGWFYDMDERMEYTCWHCAGTGVEPDVIDDWEDEEADVDDGWMRESSDYE